MSNTKFTPGPWHINTASGVQIFPATGASVCELNTWKAKEENLANAHLIAAAPELYAALECILHIFGRELPGESIGRKECYEALSVLAKARGEWPADDILKREG